MNNLAMQPRYQAIKQHIIDMIESGQWPAAYRVPSENELSLSFDVSRMTARRAVKELTDEGFLVRSQGIGTFVAEQRPQGSMMEIRNIADEIASRNQRYSCKVLLLEEQPATSEVALALGVQENSSLFCSTIVHCGNEIPLQWESRYVIPGLAPDYLSQDFSCLTPNAYLSRIAPITRGDHIVQAMLPNDDVCIELGLTDKEACLQVKRRTWCRKGVISYALLIHPGSRYQLGAELEFNQQV
ncbi:histidine utilization repressor [Endozoicomonas sp. Mp262]|uniref:histidine utilization repressor n=1 Tax=Endozoicomonas sp. Mp262 TaxID=2919499 RepID=UPI0021DAFB72